MLSSYEGRVLELFSKSIRTEPRSEQHIYIYNILLPVINMRTLSHSEKEHSFLLGLVTGHGFLKRRSLSELLLLSLSELFLSPSL